MLKIAVCDDDKDIVDKIESYVLKFSFDNKLSVKIDKYFDGGDLIDSKCKFDLIFLDIEMNILNGIEAAQKIRQVDMNVPIVYITSYSNYWRSAYKVHAFDFISKPFDFTDIKNVMSDFIKSISEVKSETVPLTTDEGMIVQNVSEICYLIVKEKRNVLVGTIYKEFIIREYLSDILQKLPDEQFCQIHRSCAVNLEFVQNILKDDGVVMKDGTWLPMSSRKQKEFFFKLSKFLRNTD